jgi:GntR family transcriptional regulator
MACLLLNLINIIKTGINENMKTERTIDRDSKEKLYVQVYTIFLEKIERGEWQSGMQIPPEDELCRIYNVSKVTVREAIQELVREGYLKRQQGKGTFVTYSDPHPGIFMRARLSEDIFGEEVKGEKKVLKRGVRRATDDIKEILMTEGEVYYIQTEKIIDRHAYQEEIFIPLSVLPEIEDEEDIHQHSLYDLIEEKGTKKIFRIIQAIELSTEKDETADTSAIKETSPALLVSRRLISSDGTPVGYTRLMGRGTTSRIQMEFERIR